jgi:hypothetical protein
MHRKINAIVKSLQILCDFEKVDAASRRVTPPSQTTYCTRRDAASTFQQYGDRLRIH